MASPIRTLNDAARHGMLIVARCRTCQREAHFLAIELSHFVQRECAIRDVLFRCPQCGERKAKIPAEEPLPRVEPRLVWRLFTVRGGER